MSPASRHTHIFGTGQLALSSRAVTPGRPGLQPWTAPFDWPLLENRFTMTRSIPVPKLAAHLDLLHPARALWKLRLGSVRLVELERHVLDAARLGLVKTQSVALFRQNTVGGFVLPKAPRWLWSAKLPLVASFSQNLSVALLRENPPVALLGRNSAAGTRTRHAAYRIDFTRDANV